jgi:hypothetical protein
VEVNRGIRLIIPIVGVQFISGQLFGRSWTNNLICAETINVLLLVVKSETDKPIIVPRAGPHFPNGATIGVEVPLFPSPDGLPINLHGYAITQIFSDYAGSLDAHCGDELSPVVKWQTVLTPISGLDGNTVAGLN